MFDAEPCLPDGAQQSGAITSRALARMLPVLAVLIPVLFWDCLDQSLPPATARQIEVAFSTFKAGLDLKDGLPDRCQLDQFLAH